MFFIEPCQGKSVTRLTNTSQAYIYRISTDSWIDPGSSGAFSSNGSIRALKSYNHKTLIIFTDKIVTFDPTLIGNVDPFTSVSISGHQVYHGHSSTVIGDYLFGVGYSDLFRINLLDYTTVTVPDINVFEFGSNVFITSSPSDANEVWIYRLAPSYSAKYKYDISANTIVMSQNVSPASMLNTVFLGESSEEIYGTYGGNIIFAMNKQTGIVKGASPQNYPSPSTLNPNEPKWQNIHSPVKVYIPQIKKAFLWGGYSGYDQTSTGSRKGILFNLDHPENWVP